MATATKRPPVRRVAGPILVLVLGVVLLASGLAVRVRDDSGFWSPATVIGLMLIAASLWFFYRVSLGLTAGVIAIVVGVTPIVTALYQLPFFGVEDDPVGPPAYWLAGIGLILVGIFTVYHSLGLPVYSMAGMGLIVGGILIVGPYILTPIAVLLIVVGLLIVKRSLKAARR